MAAQLSKWRIKFCHSQTQQYVIHAAVHGIYALLNHDFLITFSNTKGNSCSVVHAVIESIHNQRLQFGTDTLILCQVNTLDKDKQLKQLL